MSRSSSINPRQFWDSTSYQKAVRHNRQGKKERNQGNFPGFLFHMGRKSHHQLMGISQGVEFGLSSDDPSLLSVGFSPQLLHWARKRRLKFCTFQTKYQQVSDHFGSLLELAKVKQVTQADLSSIVRRIEKLPEGNLQPVQRRLASSSSELELRIFGGVRHELGHARASFKKLVVDIFPKVATYDQQERVAVAIEAAISECKSSRFSFPTFQVAWSALDLTDLTTARLVKPFWTLQDSMVAANDRGDFGYAISKLQQILDNICPNIHPTQSDNGSNGPGGAGDSGNTAPKSPSNGPMSNSSALQLAKPLRDLFLVPPKRAVFIG